MPPLPATVPPPLPPCLPQALSQDPLWTGLSAEEKVALQERGTCPAEKEREARCFFDWLHWRSNLVLNKDQLGEYLGKAIQLLLDAQRRLQQERPAAGAAKRRHSAR